jgi:putative thiamine transport system permease protein
MAAALRRLSPAWRGTPVAGRGASPGAWLARLAVGAVFALPLAAGVVLAVREAGSADAWQALRADPQWATGLALALGSAAVSTLAALALTMGLVTALHGSAAWGRLTASLAPLLAVPHAAFAIGLAWLIAPTGALARALAPLLGWTSPPAWATVNDPHALGLTLVLALKETPFLLWSVAALLARPELAARLAAEQRIARTLGHSARAWWWRAGWPQLLPLLAWPLLAVFAYGLTVVDLALIVGPTHPPTAAVLAWQALQDADPLRNARGAAGALALALLLAAVLGLVALLWPVLRRAWAAAALAGRRAPLVAAPLGPRAGHRVWRPGAAAARLWWALPALYAAVGMVLLLLGVAGPWPFPAPWPQALSPLGWQAVAASLGTVGFTAALALGSTLIALALVAAWLESTPPHWDARTTPVVLAPLVLPPLMLMTGLYQAALHLRLDAHAAGVLWAHVLVVLPYVFIVLRPAWRDLDPRLAQTAATLGRSRWAFRWQVQRPLLAAPVAAAAAVGFAVSSGQFLATQMLGAGRHPTVTTEAVTLASGGDRRTAAAFALLQALLPLAAFGAARLLQRGPR